jgi:hypothetical protein
VTGHFPAGFLALQVGRIFVGIAFETISVASVSLV